MEVKPVLATGGCRLNFTLLNFRTQEKALRHVLLIGPLERSEKIQRRLFPKLNHQGITKLALPMIKHKKKHSKDYGNLQELDRMLREEVVDEICVISTTENANEIAEVIKCCRLVGRKTTVLKEGIEEGNPAVVYWPPNNTNFKRLFDISFSLFVLLFSLPLTIVISLAIKFESRAGSVLFAQERVGFNGRRFSVYKFRTMIPDADKLKNKLKHLNEMDGPVFKITNDPRITRVGRFLRKTSLDELPQFLNVLKGEMSVVGPRPLPTKEAVKCDLEHQVRHSVKPGITCIWQTSGRNNLSYEEWKKMDMNYVSNNNFFIDLKLIFKTVYSVLRLTGK